MRNAYPLTHIRPQFGMDGLGDWLSTFAFEPRGFGHHRTDPLAVCATRVIGDFELILVMGGESRIVFQTETVILHAGDMILIPPFMPHAIETPADNPHDDYWLHFDVGPAFGQPQFLSALRPYCARRWPVRQLADWREAYEAFEAEWESGRPGIRLLFHAFVLSMVVRLLRELWPEGVRPEGQMQEPVRPVQHHALIEAVTACIQGDLAAPWNAERLADRFHVGVSTLQKAFSLRMGMPLHRFIILCRVRRAEVCLRTTGMTLDAIAAAVGFSSAQALSDAFRRVYLASPREWLAGERFPRLEGSE